MGKSRKLLFISLVFWLAVSQRAFPFKPSGPKWATANMPVAWKTNTAGSVDVGGVGTTQSALLAAFNTWQNTASYITFTNAGTTANSSWAALDYTNLMVWYESNWAGYTGGMSSHVIAVCCWWNSGGRILDSDIAFNGENYTWSASGESGKMDIQNLATHEIGHLLGLLDLYSAADTEKTMYGYASRGETMKRSLAADDINGINAVYPPGYPIVAYDPSGAYTWTNLSSGTPWTDIAAGDFDGDGNAETAVIRGAKATWGSRGYPVLIMDAGGEMNWSDTSSGTPWSNITAGDFDGDGVAEIAVTRNTRASWGSGGYPIVIVDPGGQMSWSDTSSSAPWTDIAAGDFDGDGSDELVGIKGTAVNGHYPIVILDPGGEMSWSNTSSGLPWSRVAAGDFDGDGNAETAVIRGAKATWGNLGYPVVVIDPGGQMTWDNTSSGMVWTDITAGDFDGDGDDEIALVRSARASWGSGGYPIVVLDPGSQLSWNNTSGTIPWSRIAAGNLDGLNSDAELAVISNSRANW